MIFFRMRRPMNRFALYMKKSSALREKKYLSR